HRAQSGDEIFFAIDIGGRSFKFKGDGQLLLRQNKNQKLGSALELSLFLGWIHIIAIAWHILSPLLRVLYYSEHFSAIINHSELDFVAMQILNGICDRVFACSNKNEFSLFFIEIDFITSIFEPVKRTVVFFLVAKLQNHQSSLCNR